MSSSLSSYGDLFQRKVLKQIFVNKDFFFRTYSILNIELFDSYAIKWIISAIIQYYNKYKKMISIDTLKILVVKEKKEELKCEILKEINEISVMGDLEDSTFVEDNFCSFCLNQRLRIAILESIRLLEDEKYDDIRNVVEDALRAGRMESVGYNYKSIESVIDRYLETERIGLNTPWPLINQQFTNGLIRGGHLVLFMGGLGSGKTWTLCCLGAYYASQGLDVLHYTLELDEYSACQRYDTVLTGKTTFQLRENLDVLKTAIQNNVKGNLIIKYFPANHTSIYDIQNHVQQIIQQGTIPKVILLDYSDLLSSAQQKQSKIRWDEQENILTELRTFSKKINIPIITVTQLNREGYRKEIAEADNVAGAFGKSMICDLVITLSRRPKDKISNSIRWHIAKNRLGPDGMSFIGTADFSIGKLTVNEIFNEEDTMEVRNSILDKFEKFKKS